MGGGGLTYRGPGRLVHPGGRLPGAGSPAEATGSRAPRARPRAAARRVMDGRGAGGLSGLIDEVRADGRRVTRGGGRRARGGGRAGADSAALGVSPGRPPPPLRRARAPARLPEGVAGAEARPGPGAPCAAPLPPRRRLAPAPGSSAPAPLPLRRPRPGPGDPLPLARARSSALTGAPGPYQRPGRGDRPRSPGETGPPPRVGARAPLRRDSAAAHVAGG
ncbi:transcription initiation factor TFIID subunit 4-like [Pipistrellus kuhlii]|uniref:transcription initiation factor TFIID subunit 4-like n=1 Tax=Pipistrellus kuhlii TaxID=59472 RepID=UPI00174EDF96|nr:transcription initiation factor TFIID subunit 4-like [Pipistrellus kuhlii]